MAILVCVLVVATSGAATAAGVFSAKEKKTVKKLALAVLKSHASTLTVQRARQADHAAAADRATSAGKADSATSAGEINGVTIEPVSLAMKDGDPSRQPIDVQGTQVDVYCSGGISIYIRRGAESSAPPIMATVSYPGGAGTVFPLSPGNGVGAGVVTTETVTASIREASGRITRLELESFYKPDAYGGPEDCFAQGIVQRFGP